MPIENLYTPDCIRTVSGQYVNVFKPHEDTINIEDIAHALSQQCRFGGHLPVFYTVAEHSIRVAHEVAKWALNRGPLASSLIMQALMHDASEAYLLDIPSPIKAKLTNYKSIENKLMKVIAGKYKFEWPIHETVKNVDTVLLNDEWNKIMLRKKRLQANVN